jgi:hypothetical protein
MSKNYPHWACQDCGLEANRLTCLQKYGAEPLKKAFDVSTFHVAKCEVCYREKWVTEARDFFYPNFDLLSHEPQEEA